MKKTGTLNSILQHFCLKCVFDSNLQKILQIIIISVRTHANHSIFRRCQTSSMFQPVRCRRPWFLLTKLILCAGMQNIAPSNVAIWSAFTSSKHLLQSNMATIYSFFSYFLVWGQFGKELFHQLLSKKTLTFYRSLSQILQSSFATPSEIRNH